MKEMGTLSWTLGNGDFLLFLGKQRTPSGAAEVSQWHLAMKI